MKPARLVSGVVAPTSTEVIHARGASVRFGERLFNRWPFSGVYRPPATSPATGSASSHRLEQQAVLQRALGG